MPMASVFRVCRSCGEKKLLNADQFRSWVRFRLNGKTKTFFRCYAGRCLACDATTREQVAVMASTHARRASQVADQDSVSAVDVFAIIRRGMIDR